MNLGRYAALAALLIGGACAALPFAKTPSSQIAVASAPEPAAAKLELPSIAVAAGDVAVSPVPEGSSITPASWHQPTPIVLPTDSVPLPSLPHAPIFRNPLRDAAARIHEPDFASPSPPPAPTRVDNLRKHRIVDGDSLPLIALRYLGDKERGDEIAELNRGVVAGNASLLPVGREILIPNE